jgi:hypothetical protein
METKFCKKCNEYKPLSDFYKTQKGLLCKFHVNEKGRENKKKYRENIKNVIKEKLKYQERKIRLWANILIQHTKKRNCETTLTINDVLDLYDNQNGLCFWFKIPLLPSLTKKHPQQPSIDRLDRHKGYTKDNVVLCCYAANIGRNETDLEVWKEFITLLIDKKSIEKKIDNDVIKLYSDIEINDDRDVYVIYNEELVPTLTSNLSSYAKDNEISYNSILSSRKKINRNVQKGIIVLNRSKGEKINKRIYYLESPEKKIFKLTSLRNFCINHNLNDSVLQRVAKGELNHFKGWKCRYETVILD